MTMSAPSTWLRVSSVSPRPSRPRSSSTTANFSLTSAAKASSPMLSRSGLKAGLERTSFSSRSAAERRWLARIVRLIGPTSGTERRSFSTIDLPRKTVGPVMSSVLPARPSAIKETNSRFKPARASLVTCRLVSSVTETLLLTHTDLDGVGCGVLFTGARPSQGTVELVDNGKIDARVREVLEHTPAILVTDHGVDAQTADRVDAYIAAGGHF